MPARVNYVGSDLLFHYDRDDRDAVPQFDRRFRLKGIVIPAGLRRLVLAKSSGPIITGPNRPAERLRLN